MARQLADCPLVGAPFAYGGPTPPGQSVRPLLRPIKLRVDVIGHGEQDVDVAGAGAAPAGQVVAGQFCARSGHLVGGEAGGVGGDGGGLVVLEVAV